MKVLVTGGAGFIGSHTVVSLLESGFDVVVADNFCNSRPEALRRVGELAKPDFVTEELDVRDWSALDRVFARHRIDAVIHIAALKSVGESVANPLEYYDNNLGSLTALLAVMRERDCRRLVFSSSAAVYSTSSAPPFHEDFPLDPLSPYGRTKWFAEEMLRDLASADTEWKMILLRYFNPVGAHPSGRIGEWPQGKPNNLFPYVAQVAAGAMDELQVFGGDYPTPDGTGVRDYIHVCDLAAGHVAALRALDRVNGAEAVNLGTGCGSSVLEIRAAFERAAGRAIPHRIVQRRAGDPAISVADISKARSLLGWRARRSMDVMCTDAWRWQMRILKEKPRYRVKGGGAQTGQPA